MNGCNLHDHEIKGEHDLTTQFMFAIQYVKPYEGKLWQNGQWTENVIRFYDEREWRCVPELSRSQKPLWLTKEASQQSKKIDGFNKIISEKDDLKLSFLANDIKFIIVKKEEDILPMLDKIIRIKKTSFHMKMCKY